MERLILVILVIMPGVWSGDWRVTFNNPNQCALKGTSVVIKCEYDYPSDHTVNFVSWLKAHHSAGLVWTLPLSNFPSSPGHFRYVGNYGNDCSLQINDVQPIDNGAYYFSFGTSFASWRSKTSVQLSVKESEMTTVVWPSTVTEGGVVSLTCEGTCSTLPNVVWFRDGQVVPNPVFQARIEDAGRYHCAVLGQETARSASVALNVQYRPVNVTASMDPPRVVEGSSMTMTCSSDANPAAESYTWYKTRTGSVLEMGSRKVLSLPSVEVSHAGHYFCQARNRLGESSSTEVLLEVTKRVHGSMTVTILAGLGVCLLVMLLLLCLLFWRKKTIAEKKQTVSDFKHSGRCSSSSAAEDQPNGVHVNIHTFPASPPPVADITPRSQRNRDALTSYEDEVIYSTVTIKPRNPSLPRHVNNGQAPWDSWSKAGENEDTVIYATVAKSN